MKTSIETLTFPCEIKNKLKIKTSLANLKVEFINGHILNFNNTLFYKISSYRDNISIFYIF